MKNNYERAYGSGVSEDYSSAEYMSEVKRYIDSVVKLQSLSPDQYAATSDEARQIDSLFYVVTQSLSDYGLKQEDLDAYPPFSKIDLARSKRLYEAYK